MDRSEGFEKPAAQILCDPADGTEEGTFVGTETETTGYQGLGQGVGSCLLGLEFLLGENIWDVERDDGYVTFSMYLMYMKSTITGG